MSTKSSMTGKDVILHKPLTEVDPRGQSLWTSVMLRGRQDRLAGMMLWSDRGTRVQPVK